MQTMQDHLGILLNEVDARDYIINSGKSKQKIIRCNQLRQLTGQSDRLDFGTCYTTDVMMRNEIDNQRQKLLQNDKLVNWTKQDKLNKVRDLMTNRMTPVKGSRQSKIQC